MATTFGQTCKLNAVRTANHLLESSIRMMEDLTKFDDPEIGDNYKEEVSRALAAIVHDEWAQGGLLLGASGAFFRARRMEIAAAKTWKQIAEYIRFNSALYEVCDKHLYSFHVPVTVVMDIAKRLLIEELNGERNLHDELMNNIKAAVA